MARPRKSSARRHHYPYREGEVIKRRMINLPESIEASINAIADQKKISANGVIVGALDFFCRWMEEKSSLGEDPLATAP